MKKILFVYGTRPEAIKMAPLIHALKVKSDHFTFEVCLTGQHRQMLDQVNLFFSIDAHYDLKLMLQNQSLFDITSAGLKNLEPIYVQSKPDLVFVQGDTTTAFIGALASSYLKIPVAHLEAGLRSDDRFSPFPEEINRILVSHIAQYHFAPTIGAVENLRREGIVKNVWCVGNTVIDALFLGLRIIKENGEIPYAKYFSFINDAQRIVLITGHRRESFGEPFKNICSAVAELSKRYPHVRFVYPVHLNPSVRDLVIPLLSGYPNIHLLDPLDYPHLIWLMNRSFLVLTDSGGIQEEAPSLGKPVLVMRDVTERMEGVNAGTARLVGTNRDTIIEAVVELLEDAQIYSKMATATNPYGNGTTSMAISNILAAL
ncbi:MAG: UDP-N-acetylglucosamine 2-epimerase (non-hydrolyzing) [Chitinivibrionales bacterium]|nr:UDP-N-acetylglucosamine 2-epimerase (non-hydrolyzing) [Chitinivibrionales bacterium]